METSKQKILRRIVATLKLRQQLLISQIELENYIKENHTSDCELMTEMLECIHKIENSKQVLRDEADQNNSWDELWKRFE